MTLERIIGAGAVVAVAAGVAVGFGAIGPPPHMRLVQLDQRRVDDLRSISEILWYDPETRRPGSRAAAPPRAGEDWPRDPETGKPYGYQREGKTKYRLCATFALASNANGDLSAWRWHHPAGPACFQFDLATSSGPREQVLTTTTVTR